MVVTFAAKKVKVDTINNMHWLLLYMSYTCASSYSNSFAILTPLLTPQLIDMQQAMSQKHYTCIRTISLLKVYQILHAFVIWFILSTTTVTQEHYTSSSNLIILRVYLF